MRTGEDGKALAEATRCNLDRRPGYPITQGRANRLNCGFHSGRVLSAMRFRDSGRRTPLWITVAGSLVVVTAVITGLVIWIALQSTGKPTTPQPNISTVPVNPTAPAFPKLTGRVVDEARLLSEDDERELTTNLKALEDKNTDQVVVVTLPSLQGYSIEEYGRRLGNYWGVGTREKHNGVLVLVAPNEHKVRIEVGTGLEPVLTDSVAKKIIDENIVPRFREGNFPAGIRDGVNAILMVLAS